MEKEKYFETVERAKEILKVDRQLRKKTGIAGNTNLYQAEYMSKKRALARDIGQHKHTEKLAEKKSYQFALELFLKEVFPEKFYRPFSEDQKKFIKEAQALIINGGQYACALPRGEGKSTIISCAVIWAILYGHKRFVVIACADRKPADRFMKGIKSTLAGDKLGELFPEVTHYVKALNGMSQRAAGQTSNGEPTYIGWKSNQINLPYVEMDENFLELCKGSIITASGLTCGIRGMLETLPSGEPIRPDFLFLDDPQTRESSASPQQCRDRETLIKSDLLPLSGIGTEIACLMGCTVIEENDLADKILNEWQSVRAKALYKFPNEHDGLWRDYIELYRDAQKRGEQQKICNDFYIANRARLDKGAVVGNPFRINKGEVSALQNIYNFISKYGLQSFWSELQNQPKQSVSTIYEIKPTLICSRLNYLKRYEMPKEANWLVVMGDINFIGINYVVLAVTNNFSSYVIDYGKYPESKKEYLIEENEGDTTTGSQKLSQGILDFVSHIYKKPYMQNGKRVFPNRILIDANFMTETVHNTVRSLHRKKYPIICDRGRSNRLYKPARQDKIIGKAGNNLFLQHGNHGDELVHNSDYWRMVAQKAFLLNTGVAGSLSIWGNNPREHEGFADEICSEKLVKYDVSQNFYEWHKQPNQKNDKLDALVGCYVAGALSGASNTGGEQNWRVKKVRRETRKAKIQIEEY